MICILDFKVCVHVSSGRVEPQAHYVGVLTQAPNSNFSQKPKPAVVHTCCDTFPMSTPSRSPSLGQYPRKRKGFHVILNFVVNVILVLTF